MNIVSSNINQWTLLVAMLPVVYSLGAGHVSAILFDGEQETELLLTIAQSMVSFGVSVQYEIPLVGSARLVYTLWRSGRVCYFGIERRRDRLSCSPRSFLGNYRLLCVGRHYADRNAPEAAIARGSRCVSRYLANPPPAGEVTAFGRSLPKPLSYTEACRAA